MSINLRVYRRSLDNIALLWNNTALTPEQARSIKIYCEINGSSKLLQYVTDHKSTDVDNKIDSATVTLINHALNSLSPYQDYSLMVEFGKDAQKICQPIYVYPFGVLPTLEKDDKKANSHVFGWSASESKWAKLPVVKCADGTYAVAVKLVKD